MLLKKLFIFAYFLQSQADKQTKNFRCLQMLLKFGANVNARDNYNATPLHLASHKGYEEVVDFLLNGKGAFVDVSHIKSALPLFSISKK